ncbi:MAG: hypothetical protein IKB84_03820 [Clostridia bacterium]|nr:hypothetical protein [Clostridia bacterium]
MEAYLLYFLLVPLLWFGLPRVKVLWKRYRFQKKLKAFCQREMGELTWLRDPMESALHMDGKADFLLWHRGKCYRVAVFSCLHRYREHCFLSEERLAIHRKVTLKAANLRQRVRMKEVSLGDFTRYLPLSLGEDQKEGEERILLFYPVPRELSCHRGSKKIYLGNGDPVFGGYRLLTYTAFWEELSGQGLYLKKRNPWESE